MPLVYQQDINADTKIAVWHITEQEDFFLAQVPVQREISHWHKRRQHLAGRLLLKEMYPDFPFSLILVADTRKPYLEDDPFHFSISHCGDYAAAIVSKNHRVGVDVELLNEKIEKIQHKFMYPERVLQLQPEAAMPAKHALTLYWSVKESIFKWWGRGAVDFKEDILIESITPLDNGSGKIQCRFKKEYDLAVHYRFFNGNFLTWVITLQ